MLVADSCGDANAWCRDDPNHLDLSKNSINRFIRNGTPVGDLLNNWNNRQVSWSFVPAPDYAGDIQIGFLQGAQTWWGAVSISRLPNGIHGVEYFAGGMWRSAQMNGDMGQSYVLAPTVTGGTEFRMRVRDVTDALLGGGRVYTFSLPGSCSPQCNVPYTQVAYTVG
jgi:expansin (peptidoglycan-binding protein)